MLKDKIKVVNKVYTVFNVEVQISYNGDLIWLPIDIASLNNLYDRLMESVENTFVYDMAETLELMEPKAQDHLIIKYIEQDRICLFLLGLNAGDPKELLLDTFIAFQLQNYLEETDTSGSDSNLKAISGNIVKAVHERYKEQQETLSNIL